MKSWDSLTIRIEAVVYWLCTPLYWLCDKVGLSANTITMLRLPICAATVVPLYAQGRCVLGLLCVIGCSAIDFVDGRLAQKRGTAGVYGGWLDGRVDVIFQCMVLAGVCMGHWGWLAVLALFSQSVLLHFTDMLCGVFMQAAEFIHVSDPQGTEKIAHRFLMLTGSMMWIGTHRWPLILASVLGRMEIYLWIIAVFQITRACVLWHMVNQSINPKTKYYQVLDEFITDAYQYKYQS